MDGRQDPAPAARLSRAQFSRMLLLPADFLRLDLVGKQRFELLVNTLEALIAPPQAFAWEARVLNLELAGGVEGGAAP